MRAAEPRTEKPLRADERWGKLHPTRAVEPTTRAEERWSKPEPATAADHAAGETNPMRGQTRATPATPQAAGAGCSGADGALRQTKPMAREAANAVGSDAGAGGAKRTQLADARLPGSSSPKQEKRGFAVDERDRAACCRCAFDRYQCTGGRTVRRARTGELSTDRSEKAGASGCRDRDRRALWPAR